MPELTVQQAMQIAIHHHRAGRLAEAETIFRQVLAHQPNHAEALHSLGIMAAQLGRNDVAVDLLTRVIRLDPASAEPVTNLGAVLHNQGKLDQAIAAYREALRRNPVSAVACNNLSNCLRDHGKFDEAMDTVRHAIRINPNFPEAHNNLGNALRGLGRLDEAADSYRVAIQIKPDYAEAFSNLGVVLNEMGKPQEAVSACRKAGELKPGFAGAWINLANALRNLGQFVQAVDAYRKAIQIVPDDADARANLAITLLLLADFSQGWEEFEWRWKCRELASRRRNLVQPKWQGEHLAGRTILLHNEQGLGDTIQFIRYVSKVAELGATVILECQPELHRLFQGMPGLRQIVSSPQPRPPFDFHCPLLSLPRVFATRLDSIPANIPYLHAEPGNVETWRALISDSSHDVKVGLAWAGSHAHRDDRSRSIDFAKLAPLSAVKGVRFYSLQKGPAARNALVTGATPKVIDFADKLTDFAETAAFIANLDLVITVDTAVAHLAGAMGKPVWVLLPFVPDWRWMLNHEDSPWYPMMRLFRQKSIGNWEEVIERVAASLAEFASRRERLAQ